MQSIVNEGRDALRRKSVAVVGSVSHSGDVALRGLSLAMETIQLDQAKKQQWLASLLPVKPKETGLVSMAEILAQALNDPEHTAIVVDGEGGDAGVEAGSSDAEAEKIEEVNQLVAAVESMGLKCFRNMRDAVVWVNSTFPGR